MKHKGKVIKKGDFILQPYTVDLVPYKDNIVNSILELYSNPQVTKFNEKRIMESIEDASIHLERIQHGYADGTDYIYLLLYWPLKEVIGEIHLASPKGIAKRSSYLNYDKTLLSHLSGDLSRSWMVEYYLHPLYWGLGMMPFFANTIIEEIFRQGANSVIAFCEKDNIASNKALLKMNFKNLIPNTKGDYFLWLKKHENSSFSFLKKIMNV